MMVKWAGILFSVFALSVFFVVALVAYSMASSDSFIRMVEMREGVSPGQTRVLPECSCTVRYVGTSVHGRRYSVIFDRLD